MPHHTKIKLGDVVEILSSAQKWPVGCLMIVDALYDWGMTGYIPKPFLAHEGPTKVYYRASYDEVHRVGPTLEKEKKTL